MTQIKKYVVGLGYDYDRKGEDDTVRGLGKIRSRALILGAALTAAGVGVNTIAKRFAEEKDNLGKTSQILGVTAENINAIGAAVRHEGGTLEGAISTLASLDDLIAGLRAGDAAVIGEAGRFGIDVTPILEAHDAYEGLLRAAETFGSATRQQRVQVGGLLGFDDATIRLLSRGREAVESIIEVEAQRRPIPDSYLEIAERYNDELQDLVENLGRVKDVFGEAFSADIVRSIEAVNDVLEDNRGAIDRSVKSFIQGFREAAGSLGTAAGVLTVQTQQGFENLKKIPTDPLAIPIVSDITRVFSAPDLPAALPPSLQTGPAPGGYVPSFLSAPPAVSVPASEPTVPASDPTSQTPSRAAGTQTPPQAVIQVNLDGAPIKRIVADLIADEVDQTLEDFSSEVAD